MKLQYCPNYSVKLRTVDYVERSDQLTLRARCRQWDCEYCAPINRKVWIARIMLEHERNPRLWSFVTLTLHGRDHIGAEHSMRVWRSSWDALMKRLKRAWGRFAYVRVFETHQSGVFHVHMLVDVQPDVELHTRHDGSSYWHSEDVARACRELGLGYIHDCRPIVVHDSVQGHMAVLGAYVGKYLTKDTQSHVRRTIRSAGLGRVRMIQTSLGWAQIPSVAEKREWAVGHVSVWDVLDAMAHNAEYRDIDLDVAITLDNFLE